MVAPTHDVRYSFAEYVRFERTSNVKHEHLGGKIYAMAGGTPEHAALAAAVTGILFGQLRGKPCRVYSSDLRVNAGDLTTYSDVTVVCGPVESMDEDPHTATNPAIVVEVTSPSTEDYDRGEKLDYYRQIPTLQVIVLVSHRDRAVESLHRSQAGWVARRAGPGERVEIAGLGCAIDVDELYGVSP